MILRKLYSTQPGYTDARVIHVGPKYTRIGGVELIVNARLLDCA